jgi:hypothetical protein
MTVVRDGKVVADKNLTSANMTPEEKAPGVSEVDVGRPH